MLKQGLDEKREARVTPRGLPAAWVACGRSNRSCEEQATPKDENFYGGWRKRLPYLTLSQQKRYSQSQDAFAEVPHENPRRDAEYGATRPRIAKPQFQNYENAIPLYLRRKVGYVSFSHTRGAEKEMALSSQNVCLAMR